ncbi:unnamed protein product [Parnassius apollo]|uniref:(apollo) hypothetical protein n=1 Tax=Parnassius apollo TaxID=110799 RepID=A0A8S3WF40_PARAO|nr:unnamed protein product [Parnassius apollo]
MTNVISANTSNFTNHSEVTQTRAFDLYEAFKTKESEQLSAYRSVAYVFGAIIFLSNLTVVVSSGLILRKGQQPKSTYLLLGNVSLADTIVGISIIFGASVENTTSSNPLCIFQIGMLVCPAMVSIFSVGMIAVDRYIYILHGLYYQRWFNTTKVRIGILCIWMIGLFIASLPAMGWTGSTFRDYRCCHQLYRVAGPSQEIGVLESHLDIISLSPAARSKSGQLEALVRLSPEDKQKWLQYFNQKQISYTIMVENLADILRDEEAKNIRAKYDSKQNGSSIWNAYHGHEEINNYLDDLAEQYPNLLTVVNAALTYEGRQIKYVRISTTRFEDPRKRVVVIDAGMHAREWLPIPVVLNVIHRLVVDIVNNPQIELLDWVVIPLVNPDGYEYSIAEDRFWSKTRSKGHANGDACPGVDVNRNFDHYWGTKEDNTDPCSLTYEGPSSFSEPETRVIRDVIMTNINRAVLYISLHSYGSLITYPWRQNGTLPSNGLLLNVAALRMAAAMDNMGITIEPYTIGNAAYIQYFTTGTSTDWTRAVGVPFPFNIVLPGNGYGFLFPPENIENICAEVWEAIIEGTEYILSIY